MLREVRFFSPYCGCSSTGRAPACGAGGCGFEFHQSPKRSNMDYYKKYFSIVEKEIDKRIWRFVNKTDTCWIWTGFKNGWGYGLLRFRIGPRDKNKRKHLFVHRFMLMLFSNASFTHGYEVLHSCDNPSCVNPDHLSIGSHIDNMNDMKKKGRSAKSIGNHKINFFVAEQIRHDHSKNKLSYSKLTMKYGLSKSTISYIINGNIWKDDSGILANPNIERRKL